MIGYFVFQNILVKLFKAAKINWNG